MVSGKSRPCKNKHVKRDLFLSLWFLHLFHLANAFYPKWHQIFRQDASEQFSGQGLNSSSFVVPGFEPASFQSVTQHLNQWATISAISVSIRQQCDQLERKGSLLFLSEYPEETHIDMGTLYETPPTAPPNLVLTCRIFKSFFFIFFLSHFISPKEH